MLKKLFDLFPIWMRPAKYGPLSKLYEENNLKKCKRNRKKKSG